MTIPKDCPYAALLDLRHAYANGVALGAESFGADDAPLVLLAGGMLSWPDALARLAAGGRRVVRYDLRDSGESTTADPEAPTYTLRDLATDAAALVDALGGGPAHLAGMLSVSVGPRDLYGPGDS